MSSKNKSSIVKGLRFERIENGFTKIIFSHHKSELGIYLYMKENIIYHKDGAGKFKELKKINNPFEILDHIREGPPLKKSDSGKKLFETAITNFIAYGGK